MVILKWACGSRLTPILPFMEPTLQNTAGTFYAGNSSRFVSVTKMAKSFLMKIEEEPLFHIDEINPTLYNAVHDLNGVKVSLTDL